MLFFVFAAMDIAFLLTEYLTRNGRKQTFCAATGVTPLRLLLITTRLRPQTFYAALSSATRSLSANFATAAEITRLVDFPQFGYLKQKQVLLSGRSTAGSQETF